MSEIFEGVVLAADAGPMLAASGSVSGLVLRSEAVGKKAVVFYRSDPRAVAQFTLEMDKLAAELSTGCGRALVVRYDSRIGHRSSTLFVNGDLKYSFGEADELFVSLDDDGRPRRTEKPVAETEFREGEEYETISNAIQQGLAGLGAGDWELLFEVMTT